MIVFCQTDLTTLLFQLIDIKDARNVLENEGWVTNSINNYTDEYDIHYNEFKLSKYINFSDDYSLDHSMDAGPKTTFRCYLTIKEYSSYSNVVSFKVIHYKDFFNQFKQIIVNSDYRQINQDIDYNIIETGYKKSPLEITFKEKLNSYYQITLFNYLHKKKRGSQYFKTNAIITGNKVNVRSAPSIDSEILGQVNNDDKVWIDDQTNIYANNQFILDKKTIFYTNSREYMLNPGKMVTKINSSVFYNGKYRETDSNWLTVSVPIDNKDVWGIIRKNDISIAASQKWFKIKTPILVGWVYGKFVERR